MTMPSNVDYLDILEYNTDDRTNIIEMLILDYFEHFYLEAPPNEMYLTLNDQWTVLFNSTDKEKMLKAFKAFWDYTVNYHLTHTIRIEIDKPVTKHTLLKIIKKTFAGTRIDEMGIGAYTTANIKKGFVGENVLRFIIEKVLTDNPRPDILIAFETKEKIKFIRNTLIQLREKGKRAE